MAHTALESRPATAAVNWRALEWKRREVETACHLARQAGAYAYQGPRWSNAAIRQEARYFLVQSLLLSPFQNNPAVNRLAIGNFLGDWRRREKEEQP